MSVVKQKVIWYGAAGTATGIELDDIKSITVRKGLDAKGNKTTIKLNNPLSSYDGTNFIHKHINVDGSLKIKKDDVIYVYFKHEDNQTDIDTDVTTDLITITDVVDIDIQLDQKNSELTLTCMDKTFNLLNKIWTQSYSDTDAKTAPMIIQEIVRSVSETSESGSPTGYATTVTDTSGTLVSGGLFDIDVRLEDTEGGSVQEARPTTADAYPVISIGKLFKPVYNWIEELSQVEYTNTKAEQTAQNGPCKLKHIYYIDKDNRFHWEYPNNSDDYTFVISTPNADGEVKSIKLKNSVFDIVNTVFFNAGKSIENAGMLGWYFDETSEEGKLKIKYKPYEDISIELKNREVNEGNISIGEDQVVTVDVTSGTTSWGTSYTTATEYKDYFYDEAIRLAEIRAKDFTRTRGSARWKGSMQLKGKNLIAGEKVNITAYPVGIRDLSLRIKQITHQINKSGWSTTLDLEEDEKESWT